MFQQSATPTVPLPPQNSIGQSKPTRTRWSALDRRFTSPPRRVRPMLLLALALGYSTLTHAADDRAVTQAALQFPAHSSAVQSIQPVPHTCGAKALAALCQDLHVDAAVTERLAAAQPGVDNKGFSVKELLALARSEGVRLRAVRWPAGAELILPCIAHWKFNHYSEVKARTATG